MPEHDGYLTAQQFAQHMGVNPSTISKWLRSGKISGLKQNGKWLIRATQLKPPGRAPVIVPLPQQQSIPNPGPESAESLSFSIAEFSARTYLTEYGVEKWLKEGRLQGFKRPDGQWRVNAVNLETNDFQRLVRK